MIRGFESNPIFISPSGLGFIHSLAKNQEKRITFEINFFLIEPRLIFD